MVRFFVFLSLFAAVLVRTSYAFASEGHDVLHPINWFEWRADQPPVGWFIFDFIVFVLLLVVLARKPLKKAIVSHHVKVKEDLETIAVSYKKASEEHAFWFSKAAQMEAEAKTIERESYEEGIGERATIIAEANHTAHQMRKEAEILKVQSVRKAEGELFHEISARAITCAKTMIEKNITQADHQRLLEAAINDLEAEVGLQCLERKAG